MPSKMRGFRISTELDEKLTALLDAKGKNLQDLMAELIEQATRGEDPARYEWLDKACPALAHLEDGFFCLIKAPNQKKLGNGMKEDARECCEKCQAVKSKALQREGNVQYHTCSMGGVTKPDDNEQVICPYGRSVTEYRSFKTCLMADDGKPCKHLATHNINLIDAALSRRDAKLKGL